MAESENMTIRSTGKPWYETRNGRIVVAAGVVGLFVFVFWLATKSRQMVAAAPPALVVDGKYLSFGEVWEDPAFVWNLPIRNNTDGDLDIVGFIANCPCGKIEPQAMKIPAQGTKEVRLTLDLRIPNREQDRKRTNGFTIKIIPIFPSGPDPRSGLEVLGRVRVPAEFVPSSLSFEYLEKQPPKLLAQKVRIKCLCPCEKVTAKCDPTIASVRISKDAKLSDEFLLNVSPSTALAVGKHQFALPLTLWMSGTQRYATAQLPVSVEVKSEYYLAPSLPNWGALKIGEPSSQLFQLKSRSGKDFSVTEIICGSPNVKAALFGTLHSSDHLFRVECLFKEPGEHIENVDFMVKGKDVRSNGKADLERVRLRVKCQVFSD